MSLAPRNARTTLVPLGCSSDADCDDGLFCNGAETCDTGTGECLPGTPVDCDDGVGCTVDACIAAKKDARAVLLEQASAYRGFGFPEHAGLFATYFGLG